MYFNGKIDYANSMFEEIKEYISTLHSDREIVEEYSRFNVRGCFNPKNKCKLPLDTIIDEKQTVQWNRERVAKLNSEFEEEQKRMEELTQRVHELFNSSLKAYLAKEFILNADEVEIIWEKANSDPYVYSFLTCVDEFKKCATMYNRLRKVKSVKQSSVLDRSNFKLSADPYLIRDCYGVSNDEVGAKVYLLDCVRVKLTKDSSAKKMFQDYLFDPQSGLFVNRFDFVDGDYLQLEAPYFSDTEIGKMYQSLKLNLSEKEE